MQAFLFWKVLISIIRVKNQYNPECKDDWYKLKEGEKDFYLNKGCTEYAVKAGVGSMVFWDSRTIHQGKEPEKTREQENFRIVVYVCMMPRNMSNDKALEKKKKAFNQLRVTNHWANNPKLFPKVPRTYGGELPEFNQGQKSILNYIKNIVFDIVYIVLFRL